MSQKKIRIGKIIGFHGVRGDVKVRPTSEEADWAAVGNTLQIQNSKGNDVRSVTIQHFRRQGPLIILHFKEYENRTLVEPFLGFTVYTEQAGLPEPEDGEYWVDDMIGLAVIDSETGRIRGKVKDLLSSSGSDFLEIQIDDSNETVVIPFNDHFFPIVNIEAGTVTMDLLSDFLSLSASPVTADRLEQ